MKRLSLVLWFASSALSVSFASSPEGEPDSVRAAISEIHAVSREGEGNAAAGAAWQVLAAQPMSAVPELLAGLEGANPLAANYLRSAMEAIIFRESSQGGKLPVSAVGRILLDPAQDPHARRLAYQLIEESDPDIARNLRPGMLNDPSVHLRRGAVQDLMDEAGALADAGSKDGAALIYRQALNSARDIDQVTAIADALGALDEEVDLPLHFGFLMHWQVIGPFDNSGLKGFDAVYPPEKEIDFGASYEGKSGAVTWQPLATSDKFGKVDFNQPFGTLKEVVAYACADFESDRAQTVELRLGTKNAWKVWLNGELLFSRDEYHRGQRIDQYRLTAHLNPGTNRILVKCAQNEEQQDWTVQWEFQLRVCDATGTAVLAVDRPPTPQPDAARRRPANSEGGPS